MKKTDHLPVYGVGPLCVYSMAALLIAAIVLWYFGFLDSGAVPRWQIPFSVLGCLMAVGAIVMWVRAVFYDRVGDKILENHLLTSGTYAWVRNPIYSAAAIGLTGVSLFFYNLWMLILPLLFWLDITVLMKLTEEKWLLSLYGEEYAAYCRKVNRCIPWFPGK